jgi:hypothetical protein
MDDIDTTIRVAPSNPDLSSEETQQPEIIGEYVQSQATTMCDRNNVSYAIEACSYPIVGIMSRDRRCLAEAGVVFRAREEGSEEVKTLVQFRDVREIHELAKAGRLVLSDKVKALLAIDPVLTQPEAKQENRRMGMRR